MDEVIEEKIDERLKTLISNFIVFQSENSDDNNTPPYSYDFLGFAEYLTFEEGIAVM